MRKLKHTKLYGLFALTLLTGILFGCTPSHPQSTFDTLGPVAESQLLLTNILIVMGTAVFIIVMAVLIYIVIRYRDNGSQEDPEQIHGHTMLEIIWSVVPVLVLIPLAVISVITIFDNHNSPVKTEDGGLTIQAIGHQWWFQFKYPKQDQVSTAIVTANDLHIPVDTPVTIELVSKDVIHSFWVPKLAGKVDMVPNNDNGLWLQADEPGTYLGQCAEFCGVSHANMRFKVIAHNRDDFDKWVHSQSLPAALPTDATPLIKLGHDVFMARVGKDTESDPSVKGAGCNSCHKIDGTDARGTRGPDLTHFASRTSFAGATLTNTQTNLRKWLENPEKVKPANVMAREAEIYRDGSGLSEIQVSALIAYLRSLE
ncbi:MAG: cytochrome c oxidase subunit II [Chloroflexota bacterium]|nr:cytochrome c oxidase subunit II [Chloroflexota bacterium]